MSETMVQIIQYTYTTALPLVLAYIIGKLNKISESKSAGKETDMLVLRLILVDMHDRAVSKGFITRQMYTTFDEVWTLYTEKYKGNHLTKKFKDEVDSLPIRIESWESEGED